MPTKNKYAINAKITEAKIRQIVKLFVVDLDASQIAKITSLNRNTVNRYIKATREIIACESKLLFPFAGEVEVDKSYFGARRVKGLRGPGARGKTIVFGLFKRQGKICTEIVPDCSRATLQGIIRGRVKLETVIHSVGYQKHFRVEHGKNEFATEHTHINGIESFWAFAKTRLVRFRGIHKHSFYFHLKECEFRFNNRGQDLYKIILKLLREKPLC